MLIKKGLWMMSLASILLFQNAQAATSLDAQIDPAIKHSSSHHHNRHVGPRGARGATGAPFTYAFEAGASLSFDISNIIINFVSGGTGATIQPFVSLPDSSIVLGTLITIPTGFTGVLPAISIPITNPQYGRYTFGYELTLSAGTTIVPDATPVPVFVNTSRIGSIVLGTVPFAPLANPPVANTQVFIAGFVYAPPGSGVP